MLLVGGSCRCILESTKATVARANRLPEDPAAAEELRCIQDNIIIQNKYFRQGHFVVLKNIPSRLLRVVGFMISYLYPITLLSSFLLSRKPQQKKFMKNQNEFGRWEKDLIWTRKGAPYLSSRTQWVTLLENHLKASKDFIFASIYLHSHHSVASLLILLLSRE